MENTNQMTAADVLKAMDEDDIYEMVALVGIPHQNNIARCPCIKCAFDRWINQEGE